MPNKQNRPNIIKIVYQTNYQKGNNHIFPVRINNDTNYIYISNKRYIPFLEVEDTGQSQMFSILDSFKDIFRNRGQE